MTQDTLTVLRAAHIKGWQERIEHGSSIYAKASALECEIAELRTLIASLEVAEQVGYFYEDDGQWKQAIKGAK